MYNVENIRDPGPRQLQRKYGFLSDLQSKYNRAFIFVPNFSFFILLGAIRDTFLPLLPFERC